MNDLFETRLQQYAEVIVKVGLNLQAGQRLLIGPRISARAGVQPPAASLVHRIARAAYQAGARYVDVIWDDPQLRLIRYENAPRDSFDEYPDWHVELTEDYLRNGDAILSIYAVDPDLLVGQDAELVAQVQKVAYARGSDVLGMISTNRSNWSIATAAEPAWAAKIFPEIPAAERIDRMWETIFHIARISGDDPVANWEAHKHNLHARAAYLNGRAYTRLLYRGPGTNLTVGLPDGHRWHAASMTAQNGIDFTANVPTEEVFTMPHHAQADGVVTATKPLSYGGNIIEDFTLRFEDGRVVQAEAKKGQVYLDSLLDTDEGARHLGEAALVPHSSPISQTGRLFYNTLIDENASCHLALGKAYRFTMVGGEALSDNEFAVHGGNNSLLHVDFMMGSGALDVTGVRPDGSEEPVLRAGEWAFDL